MVRFWPAVVTILIASSFCPLFALVSEGSDPAGKTGESVPIFGRDVAPVLVARCLECHRAERKSGGLSMATFDSLRAGGDSGPLWNASRSGESLIVRKIQGLDPPRMPRNQPPLSTATIEKISAWIDAGSKLDDGRQPTDSLVSLAWPASRIGADRRSRMVSAELRKEARDQASRMFGEIRPGKSEADSATIRDSGRFVVVGISDTMLADSVLQALEKAADELVNILGEGAAMLSAPGAYFLVFVFENQAEFAEFARRHGFEPGAGAESAIGSSASGWPVLVIKSSAESSTDAVAKASSSVDRAKGVRKSRRRNMAQNPTSRSRGVRALGVEALVLAVFDDFPKSPAWLESGLSLVLARGHAANPGYFESLLSEAKDSGPARATLVWSRRADDFLNDRLPADVARPLAFSLLEWIRQSWPDRFPDFVRSMATGQADLDGVSKALWGTDRSSFVAGWTDFLMRGPARKGR